MKKKYFFCRISIIVLTFLLIEIGWFCHIYFWEQKDFQEEININILSAVKEINKACGNKDMSYFMDLSQEDRVIIAYNLHDSYFRKDTIREEVHNLLVKLYYDFRNQHWHLDSLAYYFRLISFSPDLPVLFIRHNADGQTIDQYPHFITKKSALHFAPHKLGNIDEHYLSAYYPFPFSYFWERQKYGLMISLIPLLLVLYYCFLLIIQRSRDHENDRFIEEQTIFIHDLKTPLCTNRDIESRILKNLNNWPIEKIHEKLEITYRQSYHLLCNIKELLLRSVMLWGSELRNQNFDLKKALEEIILYNQADHEKIRITLDFRLPDSIICADPFHITHIIGNLINNAIKHGGEEVHIKITCSQDPQKQLIFSVQDNGPGIPSKIIKHIFRTGFRRSWSNQNNHGLGLAYVRKDRKSVV